MLYGVIRCTFNYEIINSQLKVHFYMCLAINKQEFAYSLRMVRGIQFKKQFLLQ